MVPVDIGAALADAHRHLEALFTIHKGYHEELTDQHGQPQTLILHEKPQNLSYAISQALARTATFQEELLRQAKSVTQTEYKGDFQ
jgi:hypothetical protein